MKHLIILVTALMLNGQWSTINGQKKEGHWVDPVEYFKLKGKGDLTSDALYRHMWETKERYIVGMKCTVCNFTTQGDKPTESNLPVTKTTFYLYIDEPGVITAVSDWTTLPSGNLLGVYKIGATDVKFSFDENTHTYSFFYYPEGSYDFAGTESLNAEHSNALDERQMAMFYSKRKGLIGYFENDFMQNDDWMESGTPGELIDVATRHEYFLQFHIDEVLLDGTDTPLTESERLSLIETMDDLTDWLMGKGDPLGLGEHTNATESAVIEIISFIGALLLGNGIATVTGGGAGGALGALASGGVPPTMPETPQIEGLEPKRPEEEEEKEDNTPPPPEESLDFFNKYTTTDADGDIYVKDPVTGKETLYINNGDGTYRNFNTDQDWSIEEINQNLRYRDENSGLLTQDAETAAKNAAEQHAQWEKESQELSKDGQDYLKWKHAQEAAQAAAEKKEALIYKLAEKYGVPPTEKAVTNAIKWEKIMNQIDSNTYRAEGDAWDQKTTYLETVDKTCEIGVNVMATCVPGGEAVKDAYTFAKSSLVAVSEAVAEGKSLGEGAAHVMVGMGNGALGVIQNRAGDLAGKGQYALVKEWGINVVTEDLKEGMTTYYQTGDLAKARDAMLFATGKKTAEFGFSKTLSYGTDKLKESATNALSGGESKMSEGLAKKVDYWFNKTHTAYAGKRTDVLKIIKVNNSGKVSWGGISQGFSKFYSGNINTGKLTEGIINETMNQTGAHNWAGHLAKAENDLRVEAAAYTMYGAGVAKDSVVNFAKEVKEFSNKAADFRKK